ncbi:MAG: branched-chain amino acid ABC transporter permease, partial [Deltaproteobacteria bacterium]|nr:branched-chain amino acid ABC transporter permease [Deltaproteobacteria bacterium]
MDLIESYSEELKLARKTGTKAWVLAIVVAVFLLPLYAPEGLVYVATLIAIYTVGVLGQNLLIGFTGQISFAQAGFFCIGAFSFGHLVRAGLPWYLSLIASGVITGISGLPVGFPSLRLKGPYLAIATMGFGIAVYQIFVNSKFLSGGRMGLAITKLEPMFGLSTVNYYFYLYFIIAILFTLLTYNIVSSYMGRAFIAIRDNDIAAEILGVNLTRYKLLSFVISSFYMGVQGGLYALFIGYLEPNMFTFMETITFLVAVIVGGLAFVEGAILGSAFVILVPHLFSNLREFVPVVFGVAIIIILIFEPGGLAGRWMKIR